MKPANPIPRGRRPLPPQVVLAVFIGLGLGLSHFLAFKLGQIAGAPSAPAAAASRTAKPPIRVPLFVDPARVRQQPRFRFTYDSPQSLLEVRRFLGIDGVMAPGADPWQRITLWLDWVRAQWPPGRPDPYPPLDARVILERIRSRATGGFCAQYNYVFVQGLQSLAIPARYVTIRGHEVTEVWMAAERRWVCWDPLYRCCYVGSAGEPLSVLDIRRALEAGRAVALVGGQGVGDTASHLRRFLEFAVWLKNDHIASPINFFDIERYKVHFVENESERRRLPANALFTPFPEDLYTAPEGSG